MFSETNSLKAIIILDETPKNNQFTNVKSELENVIFYVPSENAEKLYEMSVANPKNLVWIEKGAHSQLRNSDKEK